MNSRLPPWVLQVFGGVIGAAELLHYLHSGNASYPISTLALGLLLLGAGVGQGPRRGEGEEDYPTPPDLRGKLKRSKRPKRVDEAEQLEQLEEGVILTEDLEEDL